MTISEPLHPHLAWITSVLAMCAASNVEQLPGGVSQHQVGDWTLTINNGGADGTPIPPDRIAVTRGGELLATIDPSTSIFDTDEQAFMSDMRAALPVGHHLKEA